MPAALARERILLIGDGDRQVYAALRQALPLVDVTPVEGVFDGLAELAGGGFSTVMTAAEPIERRPEAAIRAIREFLPAGRLLLFGHPTLEPLSRKMLEFGVDDYVVTPATPRELQQMFGIGPAPRPALALGSDASDEAPCPPEAKPVESPTTAPSGATVAALLNLPLAEILLESLHEAPRSAFATAVSAIDARLSPALRLSQSAPDAPAPSPPEGYTLLSHSVWLDRSERAVLHLLIPRHDDHATARHFLAQLAMLCGRLTGLQERHAGLEQLAITDELTGLYNSRFFKHYLERMCAESRRKRFPVTLLLFDIDNFKKYNDEYGHAVGDEILRQTAALMKRCCRPHDRVFRIAGDEFAVVFCETEPPRQPLAGTPGVGAASTPAPGGASRVPESIVPILERFRRSIANPEFAMLGRSGKGILTISGGLAVFPFDAATPGELLEAADRALMFGAKRSGKNSIYLVGGESGA